MITLAARGGSPTLTKLPILHSVKSKVAKPRGRQTARRSDDAKQKVCARQLSSEIIAGVSRFDGIEVKPASRKARSGKLKTPHESINY